MPAEALERAIAGLGEGVSIVGLANHIGFVVVDGRGVRLVHASYTDGQVVIDEPLVSARAIADRSAELWLRGEPIPLRAG